MLPSSSLDGSITLGGSRLTSTVPECLYGGRLWMAHLRHHREHKSPRKTTTHSSIFFFLFSVFFFSCFLLFFLFFSCFSLFFLVFFFLFFFPVFFFFFLLFFSFFFSCFLFFSFFFSCFFFLFFFVRDQVYNTCCCEFLVWSQRVTFIRSAAVGPIAESLISPEGRSSNSGSWSR